MPARLPTALEMTRRIVDHFNNRQFSGFDPIRAAINFVIGALTAHHARSGGRPDWLPDVETVVSAIELLSERDDVELAPFVAVWDPHLGALEEAASPAPTWGQFGGRDPSVAHLLQIARSLGGMRGALFHQAHLELLALLRTELRVKDASDLGYLAPLVDRAKRTGALLATLNYDMTIEEAAQEDSVPYSHGLSEWNRTGGIVWDPGSVRIAKLHGSINWTREVADDLPGPHLKMPHETVEIGAPTAPDSVPFVVYGRREKLRPQGPFLELRNEVVQELRRSHDLVVVGYGFGDSHINEMITTWLNGDTQRRLFVVDPYFPESWPRATGYAQTLLSHLQEQDGPAVNVIRATRLCVLRQSAADALPMVCGSDGMLDDLFRQVAGEPFGSLIGVEVDGA